MIIDLGTRREKRDGPDAEFKTVIDGEAWYMFSASYNDGEAEYSFRFWATDMADAERRVELMKQSVKLDGQIYHEETQ